MENWFLKCDHCEKKWKQELPTQDLVKFEKNFYKSMKDVFLHLYQVHWMNPPEDVINDMNKKNVVDWIEQHVTVI